MLTIDRKCRFLDPRTKLLLLVTLPTFLLGGAGGDYLKEAALIFSLIPFILLFLSRNYLTALSGLAVFVTLRTVHYFLPSDFGGLPRNVFLILYEVFCLLLPCGILATFVMRTTTAGEFIAGMEKLGIPSVITIPCSVMFRFFPTIREEYAAIGRAMKMRGVGLGQTGLSEFLEYRMVPVMMSIMIIGNELSAAALTKGLGAKTRRTSIHELKFGVADIMLIILCLSALLLFFLSLFNIKIR